MPNGFGIPWTSWIVLDFFWYWKCTWKNPLFQACSGIVLEFRIFTIIFLRHNISGCSLFGSPICDKIYFNCVQGSLNNRSSHQLTVIFLLYFICECFHNQIDWYDIFSSTAGLQIIFNCYQDDIQLFAKVFGKLHILVFWDLEGIQWYMVWVPSLKLGGRWWISNCYNSRGLVFSDILGEGSNYISCGWRGGAFLHISCYIRI